MVCTEIPLVDIRSKKRECPFLGLSLKPCFSFPLMKPVWLAMRMKAIVPADNRHPVEVPKPPSSEGARFIKSSTPNGCAAFLFGLFLGDLSAGNAQIIQLLLAAHKMQVFCGNPLGIEMLGGSEFHLRNSPLRSELRRTAPPPRWGPVDAKEICSEIKRPARP